MKTKFYVTFPLIFTKEKLHLILGDNYLEEIERKQDELASMFSFIQDLPNSASLKDEQSLNDFDKEVRKSLLISEEFQNKIKITRAPNKKLSFHSPLLTKTLNTEENKEISFENKKKSYTNFKEKNFLKIETEEKIPKNYETNISIISGSRASYNPSETKNLDLFDFALIFENMKQFQHYFPENNSENVIKKLNQDKLGKSKKSHRKKQKQSLILSKFNSKFSSLSKTPIEQEIKQ